MISDWRYRFPVILRTFLIAVAIHILFCALVYRLAGPSRESRILLGTVPVLIYMGLFLFFTRYRDGRAIFSLASVVLLCTIGTSLCSLAAPYGSPLWLILWLCFMGVDAVLLWRLCRKPFRMMLRNAEKGWLKLCVLPLSLFACLYAVSIHPIVSNTRPFYKVGTFLLCVLSVLVYVALYQFVKSMWTQYSVQQDLELLHAQMTALGTQAEQAAAADRDNRVYRHDQRHFLQLLRTSAAAGDTTAVVSVLDAMDRQLDELELGAALYRFTGQPLLDTVLSLGVQRADKQDTELLIRIVLPAHWDADFTEFTVVVSNALENALHACAQITQGQPRRIELLGSNTPEQFFLAISNTCRGTVRLDPDTGCPVSEREGHGYGNRSIAAFAAKHNGIVQYSARQGWFCMKLLF